MAVGFKALLEQISGNASRSTVLKPLGWALAMFLPATILSAVLSLAPWLVLMFAGLTLVTGAIYLLAYSYCLVRNPDALRSETFSIQKLAIEKQLVGDDKIGVLELEKPAVAGRRPLLLGDRTAPEGETQ